MHDIDSVERSDHDRNDFDLVQAADEEINLLYQQQRQA